MSKKHIIYFPLEPYKERYTVQLSAKEDGWLTHRWASHDIPFTYIEGKPLRADSTIHNGSVLDANGRGYWCCSQIMNFLERYNNNEFDHLNSVIYFDDMWSPGIEALAYAFHLTGKPIPMYAMLHAQSIDIFDFTYPMRHWMRHFEKGIGKLLSGIFVTSTVLKDLCLEHGIGNDLNVFTAGLPYNSDMVREKYLPTEFPEKKRQVVFSSRLDWEKNPLFFVEVATKVKSIDKTIDFIYTTSKENLGSNDEHIQKVFEGMGKTDIIEMRVNQDKQQYYQTLLESAVQFNCAWQDFVSWTLLEALTCHCTPVYPYFRSFPEVLPPNYLYTPENVDHAVDMIMKKIDEPFNIDLLKIVKGFDNSWARMYEYMNRSGYDVFTVDPLHEDSFMSFWLDKK
jgi:glycosyltransferase involved in cell wall biosynthesis